MIQIYKLGDDFRFHEYDTWDGKFSGPLSRLDLKEEEVKKQFNTSYYRTADVGKDDVTKLEIPDEVLEAAGIDPKKMSPDQLKAMFAKLKEKGLLKPEPGDKKKPAGKKPAGKEGAKEPEGAKGSGRPGLVKKKIEVHRGGKTFTQERWVRAGDDEPVEKPKKGEEEAPPEEGKPEVAPVPEKPKGPVIQGLNKPEGEEEEPEEKKPPLDTEVGAPKPEETEAEPTPDEEPTPTGPKNLPDEEGNVGKVSVGDWVDSFGLQYRIDGFDEDNKKVNMSNVAGTKTAFGYGEFNGLVDLIPEDKQEGLRGFSTKLQEGDVVTVAGEDMQVSEVDRNNQTVVLGGKEYSFKDLNKNGKFKASGAETFIEVPDKPSKADQMGLFKDNVKPAYDEMPRTMKLPKSSEKEFKTAMDMTKKEGKEVWCLHGVGNDTMVPGSFSVGNESTCMVKSYNGKWSSHHTHPEGGILSFSDADICNTAQRCIQDPEMMSTMQDESTGMMWVSVPTPETAEIMKAKPGLNAILDVKKEYEDKWGVRLDEIIADTTIAPGEIDEAEGRAYRNLVRDLANELKIKIYSGMPGEELKEYDGW